MFPSLISEVSLIWASARCCFLLCYELHVGQCLSAFSGLGYCRYLYPTHLYLTTHPLTYECPYFTRRCSPPPTNPMSVLLLLAFVFTCILLIPFPNPGLGYRAAEKPDPPRLFLLLLPSRRFSPWLQSLFFCICSWENKWQLGLKIFKRL